MPAPMVLRPLQTRDGGSQHATDGRRLQCQLSSSQVLDVPDLIKNDGDAQKLALKT